MMGKTTPLSVRQRERLLEIAQEMLEAPSIIDTPLQVTLQNAVDILSEDGQCDALGIARTIYRLGDERQQRAVRLAADAVAGLEFGVGRFSREMMFASRGYRADALDLGDLHLPGFLAAGEAHARVEDYSNILGSDPARAVDYIFQSFASEQEARETIMGTDGSSAHAVLLKMVREKVSGQIIAAFVGSGGEVVMPQPARFREALAERLDIGAGTLRLWEHTAFWKPAMAAFFAEVLASGVDMGVAEPQSVEGWSAAVARKGEWFSHLQARGCTPAYIKRMIDIHFRTDEWARIVALSELGRFSDTFSARPWAYAHAPEVFYRNLKALHALEPNLHADEFVRLLTPVVSPLDLRSIDKLMARHRKDAMRFKQRHAANLFAWHVEPPAVFARRLTNLVMRNRKYGNMQRFLAAHFSVRIEHLRKKLADMMREGVDIDPIIKALQTQFGARAAEPPTPLPGMADVGTKLGSANASSQPQPEPTAPLGAAMAGGVQTVLPFAVPPTPVLR